MGVKRDTTGTYVRQFAAAKAGLPGGCAAWLGTVRARALERFADLGFPTRRVEQWKFTDLRPLSRTAFAPAPRRANGIARDDVAAYEPDGLECHLMVFVDGYFRADLSRVGGLPAGARLTSLAEALDAEPGLLEEHFAGAGGDGEQPFVALNTAFMADGAVLMLDDGVALERPVHLLFVGTAGEAPGAAHVRNVVVAGAGSSATVIETYAAPAPAVYWTNAVTDVVAGAGAAIRHVKLQAESRDAFHVAATRATLAGNSVYDNFTAALGGRLARNEIDAVLDGEGAECRLGGVTLARGRQHLDTTTLIDHAKPDCVSDEHYRSVLDDSAHGVFQGRIVVRPGAQKTNANQLNKNLLLSRAAQVDSKPELEIRADDVKCSHGATTGESDADALFYLRSRGIGAELARSLLIEAFVSEIVDSVEDAGLRAHLWGAVAGWLRRAGRA